MNWTGGRRARHNSNSALNTSARLQKQYFARVRMARESRQSVGNLVRSSSPIGLAEVIRPLKSTGKRDQSASKQDDKTGPGLESGFGQDDSRSLWGPQESRLQQGAEGRKQAKDIRAMGRKKTSLKSRILALDLGEESVEVPKKPEVLKQKKSLLLREGDWLGTKKRRNDDENSIDYDTEIRRGCSQIQVEEFNSEGENEDSDAILLEDEEVDELPPLAGKTVWQNAPFQDQHGRNYASETLDGNDSIFLEVGNVWFSTCPKRRQNQPLVREKSTLLEEGDSENEILTSDSMLLNFEDGVIPFTLGSVQREPELEDSVSLVHGAQAEDSSNSESFFTWSSSNYAGKNGRSSTPALSAIRDFVNVDDTYVPQRLLVFPPESPDFEQASGAKNTTSRARSSSVLPNRKPVNTAEGRSDQMAMQHLHEPAHFEDEIRNSSLDAFASSVAASEDHLDDGQWIDMILNEYPWGGTEDDSYTGPNAEYGVVGEGSVTMPFGDMETPVKGITASEREENSWRDIGLQSYAMGEFPEGDIREHDLIEGSSIPQAESTMANEITIPEGKPQQTEHKIDVDLDDDKAWRDFVYQPSVKEDWGEQNEESSSKDGNCKRRKRSKFLYLGESEDDYILPLRKKRRAVVKIPSNSELGNGRGSHLAVDARSNTATAGTQLSSSISSSAPASENDREVDLDCSILGNISSSSNGNIDGCNGCSSVVVNVSSSPLATVPDSVETESTESTKSSSPSRAPFVSALKGRNKSMRCDSKKVMWGEDVKEKESPGIAVSKRCQTEPASTTKAITGLQKVFEGTRRKGAREAVDEIEDW
ncbi:hypothetical protein L211DRAFT_847630 [Terfezia boudieri ATCC MYA-4762]|uniref:Uncharacterized protein n=1 Tax=Terfezia boudieri ATCC MYA-4762 TaxID=1051890 RepID=A0A3N4LSG4_9PEZI|nr:hypothetical protein L211DRAFT_847630 [Terfezia boudieri ATCC MYA-4762]